MKKWKKLMTLVFTCALLLSFPTCDALAAKQPYTYKVTIYAGIQGTFSGTEGLVLSNKEAVVTQTEDKIVISGLQYGDEVAYTAQADVKPDSTSKYYVQGIRLSGRDNDTVAASAFIVREDIDYVVAYGIKGNQVSYTVNYYDEQGNAMLPSETFYGNVGDKPVIACKYIDGYLPQASGLTKTLQENAAENVLTFEYRPFSITVIEDVYTTVVENEYVNVVRPGGGGAGTGGAGTGAGTGGTGTGGAGTTGGEDGPGTAGGAGEDQTGAGTGGENEGTGTGGGETGTDENIPAGSEASGSEDENEGDDLIIDLDDEKVPLAEDPNGNEQQNLPLVKYSLIMIAALIALGVLTFTTVRMKKNDKNNENE